MLCGAIGSGGVPMTCAERNERVRALGLEFDLLLQWDAAMDERSRLGEQGQMELEARRRRRGELIRELMRIRYECRREGADGCVPKENCEAGAFWGRSVCGGEVTKELEAEVGTWPREWRQGLGRAQ